MTSYAYEGDELDIFAHAVNWKGYLRSVIAPYIAGDVLEVGAGLGGTTRVFATVPHRTWTCLEPDPQLAATLREARNQLPITPVVRVGTLADCPRTPGYDTCLYIDVLEHIQDDRAELDAAAARLRPNGTIVVMSPAHQWLYSPFDKRIGHYRRYDRAMFERLAPKDTTLERVAYLDSAGLLLSTANRIVLRSGNPTLRQVLLWDRWFTTASRRLDRVLGWRLGKSILGVWRKRANTCADA
jgi:hypothetical protein